MSKTQGVVSINVLSTIKRSKLETSFLTLHKENINLRRALQQQINETNRTRVLLLELLALVKYRKVLKQPMIISDKDKKLQTYIDLLNEKITVLTQQLLDHSRYHREVHKCYKNVNRPQNIISNVIDTIINEPSNKAILDHINSGNENNSSGEKNTDPVINTEVKSSDAKENKTKDNEMDSSDEMDKVLNNLDKIRLRRLIKRQAIQNANLSFHVDAANKEASNLRAALEKLQADFETLTKQMTEEKSKQEELQSLQIELNFLRHNNKILVEEIRDIKEEKNTLKLTNEKLLIELDVIRTSEIVS